MVGLLALAFVVVAVFAGAAKELPIVSGSATDGSEVPFPYVAGVLMKPGVITKGIKPETIKAVQVTREVFLRLALGPVVVTSVLDGTHMIGSLHKLGYAVDIRTRHLTVEQRQTATKLIRADLGAQYDVLNEGPGPGHDVPNAAAHIHEEFDP